MLTVPLVPFDGIDLAVARNRGYFAYPPSGPLFIAATFRELGVPTHILDLNYEVLKEAQRDSPDLDGTWKAALTKALERFKSPLIAISIMFDTTYEQFAAITREVRCLRPDLLIAAGGVAATGDPERLLNEGHADLVFLHEGENPLKAFYGALESGNVSGLYNLAFRDKADRIHRFPIRPSPGPDLDLRPEFDQLPIADYCNVGSLSAMSRFRGADRPFAAVLTRRGCRARCSFCSVSNFNGRGVRLRGRERVMAELEHLYHHHGVRHFSWLDDDLLYNHDDIVALFKDMAERLPGITWFSDNGVIASAVTREILEAVESSGGLGLQISLETGNPGLLRAVHKPTTHKKVFGFACMVEDFPRLFMRLVFILGLPKENFGQMLDSLVTAVHTGLDWVNFFTYQHLKNTELYSVYSPTDLTVEGDSVQLLSKDFNPVRSASFRDPSVGEGLARGYDVFDLPLDSIPSRRQLNEIWFTFNMLVNFLLLPALRTDKKERIANAAAYIRSVRSAYPTDASMVAVLYYLENRLVAIPPAEVEALRTLARELLEGSDYWQMRDSQFGFTSLLEDRLPEIDPRARTIIDEGGPEVVHKITVWQAPWSN